MKFLLLILLSASISYTKQENAAPSIHLVYRFPSPDAILKMQKIRIMESADASYFEVNSFTNGYAGFQQTADKLYKTPNIFLTSLWDPDTKNNINSFVDYIDANSFKQRFGGEGDGWKTVNSFKWKPGNWYNIVNRGWKSGGRLYIAAFINDISTGKWLHTTTFSIPDPGKFLGGNNDAFLENWDGTHASQDGRFTRKAYFKDCWILTEQGKWEKSNAVRFSANAGEADVKRNGKYHNSFDAGYDPAEDAYYMQHGGDTKPSEAFNGARNLSLPLQAKQGEQPLLPTCIINSVTTTYKKELLNVSWSIDEKNSPQLSYKVVVLNAAGEMIKTIEGIEPGTKSVEIKCDLPKGEYLIKIMARDIFDVPSKEISRKIIIN